MNISNSGQGIKVRRRKGNSVKAVGALLLASLQMGITNMASAAIVPPADQHQVLSLKYDLGAPPADTYIWKRQYGGYDTDTGKFTPLTGPSWICNSQTDSSHGACRDKGIESYTTGTATIVLRFTEERSKASVDINLIGIAEFNFLSTACTGWLSSIYPSTSGGSNYCTMDNRRQYAAKALSLYIPAAEMNKFPTGGNWKGKLILTQLSSPPFFTKQATFSADITLDVTDRNHGAIYLTRFGSADPRVDLNLRTKPLSTAPGGEVSGGTSVDMCLYDGYNSNSSWLKLTLSDLVTATGRPADIFSVVRDGSKDTTAPNRVDYKATLNFNGQAIPMSNGVATTLSNINTTPVRMVRLPGMLQPVACMPASVDLKVPPFAKLSKSNGHFTGTLRVTLAADTLAP